MKRALRRIRRGAGYLEGYGEHSGTSALIATTIMGAAVALPHGWLAVLKGAGVMLAIFGTAWLVGAHERGRDWEKEHGIG